MLTDMRYGTWIDQTVKQTAENLPTYMYVFNYRSWEDWRDKWMGKLFRYSQNKKK